MSLYAEMRDYLENAPVTGVARRFGVEDAIPTEYGGTTLRSRLEAGWARTLDHYGIAWEYEPELAELPSGARYLPDFRLPDLATVIEVKGPHMQRVEKTREYAKEVHPDVIVLIGYPPAHRSLSPWLWQYYMQWNDALGYPLTFTSCTDCGAYQWCRPRFSLCCRRCGAKFDGHLAACGEMRFLPAETETSYSPPSWFGNVLNAMVPSR